MSSINEFPLKLRVESFYDSPHDLPFNDFPLINDFYINIYKTQSFGYQLDYRSEKYGLLSNFPWWDNIERETHNEKDIPIGTLEEPFDDLEQGWQIYIFEKDCYVYVLQGEDPCCNEFPIWYKVDRKLYCKRWNEFISKIKSMR